MAWTAPSCLHHGSPSKTWQDSKYFGIMSHRTTKDHGPSIHCNSTWYLIVNFSGPQHNWYGCGCGVLCKFSFSTTSRLTILTVLQWSIVKEHALSWTFSLVWKSFSRCPFSSNQDPADKQAIVSQTVCYGSTIFSQISNSQNVPITVSCALAYVTNQSDPIPTSFYFQSPGNNGAEELCIESDVDSR